MPKSDKKLGEGLRNVMDISQTLKLEETAEREKRNMGRIVAVILTIIVLIVLFLLGLYMAGVL